MANKVSKIHAASSTNEAVDSEMNWTGFNPFDSNGPNLDVNSDNPNPDADSNDPSLDNEAIGDSLEGVLSSLVWNNRTIRSQKSAALIQEKNQAIMQTQLNGMTDQLGQILLVLGTSPTTPPCDNNASKNCSLVDYDDTCTGY